MLTKDEMRAKFVREYTGIHPSLIWTETDRKSVERLTRSEMKRNTMLKRNWEIKQARKSGKTLAEVGKMFGITRQRVEQIIK